MWRRIKEYTHTHLLARRHYWIEVELQSPHWGFRLNRCPGSDSHPVQLYITTSDFTLAKLKSGWELPQRNGSRTLQPPTCVRLNFKTLNIFLINSDILPFRHSYSNTKQRYDATQKPFSRITAIPWKLKKKKSFLDSSAFERSFWGCGYRKHPMCCLVRRYLFLIVPFVKKNQS